MKTGSALALIAVGAILAFAVHAHLRFFSFQIAGWVIMLTGIAGLMIPRRGHSWLRRVTRRPRAAAAAGSGGGGRLPIGWTLRRRPSAVVVPSLPPDPVLEEPVDGTVPRPVLPGETVEEEFFQE
jgi:hypothetical protein